MPIITVCAAALGWMAVSQSKFGAQVADIQRESYGASTVSAYRSLGWLWTNPLSSTSDKGLGRSITWAWDPVLCDRMVGQFKEDYIVNFANCDAIKAAMHRAFATWSQNHPAISFVEVTGLCEATGQLKAGATSCSHAEIWVTAMNRTRATGLGSQAAIALPSFSLANAFRYTNGQQPVLTVGSITLPRNVIEVTGGRIEFAYQGICWYLDSNFCSAFHSIKRATSPTTTYVIGVFLLFFTWSIAMLYILYLFAKAVQEQLRIRHKAFVDLDGDGTIEAHEVSRAARATTQHRRRAYLIVGCLPSIYRTAVSCARRALDEWRPCELHPCCRTPWWQIARQIAERTYWRTQAFVAALASESIIGTALRFTVLFLPWPFYTAIFQVLGFGTRTHTQRNTHGRARTSLPASPSMGACTCPWPCEWS